VSRGRHLLVLLCAAVLVAGCGDDADRDDKGAITTGGDQSAFDLKVGDCFNDPEGVTDPEGAVVTKVAAVPCSQGHDNEVFGVVKRSEDKDAALPGQEVVTRFGTEECAKRFQAYVGKSPQQSDLALAPLSPTKESWEQQDDRTSFCVLYELGKKLTGSKKGSEE